MKTPNPDNPIRNTLKHLALGAVACLFTSTASAAPPVTTGLKLHLDASQLTGLTDGATVDTLTDVSGLGNHATRTVGAPTYETNELNGQPVVRFPDGNGAYFSFPNMTDIRTVFWVVKESTSNLHFLMGHSSNYDFHRGDGGTELWSNSWASDNIKSGTTKLNGVAVNGTATNLPTGWNLVSLGTTGNVSANQLTQDRTYGRYWEGDIAEVLIYNEVLSPADELLVGGYLTEKYGLTTTYPTGLTVTLTSPANNAAYLSGTSITATATVSSGSEPYNVKLFTRSLPGGTFAQAGGNVTTPPYTLDLGPLSDGSYEIYAEVTDSAGSPATDISATHTFTVAPAITTTTTVASSGSPTTYGDSVTFTATVTPAPSGGTVQFKNGGSSLGTPVSVNATTGQATVTTTTLGVAGPNAITAEYSGYQIYEPSSTAASISQEVNKAGLTVTAVNMFRLPNTANPDPFLYLITGFKNGETLGTSGVTGTPALSTKAVLESPVGPYPITCTVGDLNASNYSFTPEDGTLAVADPADTFSVSFYSNHVGVFRPEDVIQPGIPAGYDDWLTSGWLNYGVAFGVEGPYVVPLTSNKGSSATFTLFDARNGGETAEYPRTTNLGDGNYSLMAGLVHGTSLESEPYMKFDMDVTNIPFATYDVIFYFGSSYWNGNRTGKIEFNGAAARAFTLQAGAAYDGTFTEMVDGTTLGNYIVYKGVTGSSFTAKIYGDGFNHLGPTGFQIRKATGAAGYGTWAAANGATGQTPDQDHDNDGVENGIEYFMGQTGSSFTAMPGLDGTNTVSWTMDPAYSGTYEVQTSPDLVTWTNVDPKPMPSGGNLNYTLPPGAPGGKSFVRLLVTPTP